MIDCLVKIFIDYIDLNIFHNIFLDYFNNSNLHEPCSKSGNDSFELLNNDGSDEEEKISDAQEFSHQSFSTLVR